MKTPSSSKPKKSSFSSGEMKIPSSSKPKKTPVSEEKTSVSPRDENTPSPAGDNYSPTTPTSTGACIAPSNPYQEEEEFEEELGKHLKE